MSRVGDPLVEDWLIPYGEKAAWRTADPAGDGAYETRYSAPELATLLNQAYPGNQPARTADRSDIVQLLGQGLPGLNQTTTTGVADMLRLNLAVPPTRQAEPPGAHGRRPGWLSQRAPAHR